LFLNSIQFIIYFHYAANMLIFRNKKWELSSRFCKQICPEPTDIFA